MPDTSPLAELAYAVLALVAIFVPLGAVAYIVSRDIPSNGNKQKRSTP